jgi:hypothetical protein
MRSSPSIRPRLVSLASLWFAVLPLAVAAFAARAAELNVTNDLKYRWGEHQIAINPKNPNNIVYATVGVGFTNDCQAHSPACEMVKANFGPGFPLFPQANGIFTARDFIVIAAYSSFDGGKTWKRAIIPAIPADHPDITGPGDPSVTVTPDGTFYFGFDDNNWGTPEKALPNAGVGVSKSTDGGLTWSTPVLTGTPVDGPKVLADQSTGTIYSTSSTYLGPRSTGDPNSPPGKINTRWVASSKDGVHWTTPQPMGGSGMASAAHGMLATAFKASATVGMFSQPNGELCGSTPPPCTVFQTTTDSGATWSRHVMSVPTSAPSNPGDQPLVAADPSKAGHFAVAFLMEGKEFQVYQTRDAGKTWSGPTIVTDDATKRHYHGWMVYSRQGVLGIMWRTMQPPPGQTVSAPPAGGPGGGPAFPYNVWAVISKDGGTTFSAPLQVSTADSPAPQAGMFANGGDDYSAMAIDRDNVYVGWADWRPPERQGFINALKLDDFKQKH